ncbi:Probable lipoprotein precursor [Tenacibaculum maritimum]|uniref:hypothetical protein n=1 Tax=Tenacibaculum maritimum TaxID=107401 RepID=UPI0012E52FF3|nr:hypothetical protein [Tenacibaculum maritimum]CAA0153743.1 Probable lipoprotein precursor [Tenacibaculum maritimum]CAA0170942.1 Probable lipoprotein precursor [Tenacibaculum maritimum]
MNKILLFLLSAGVIMSCNSVKTTQKAINSGDYEKAISLSLKKLKKNKKKEKNQPYVAILKEAFQKAVTRDKSRIEFLKKEANPSDFRKTYELYLKLNNRQERIKPLLPLFNYKTGKEINFNFVNYDQSILETKEELSEYLYNKGASLLKEGSDDKFIYREVFKDLEYISKINPNYKDIKNMMKEIHVKGTDYVYVSINNETQQIIPSRLEEDLLAMDTYGLNNFWTVYHTNRSKYIDYDFDLELNLVKINISPEQVHEKEIIREKQIKDGYEYLLDSKGNYVKDSLGYNIKVDKLLNVRCELYRFTQFKSCMVQGVVNYINNYSNKLIRSFPIQSEFVFEHSYANYTGDKRALETSFLNLINLEAIRFPTNEQMVYDTGKDLKEKLKYIIRRNKFRN